MVLSTGKNAHVAPYSGHMLEMVARSAMDRDASPGPKNSTNLPTTPSWRRFWWAQKQVQGYGVINRTYRLLWKR